MMYSYMTTQGGYNEKVKLWVKCSQCHNEVDHKDAYCRRCGHKLEPLPAEIPTYAVCDLMTEVIRNHPEIFKIVKEEPEPKKKGKKK